MTSSVSDRVGAPTESNYCTANHFVDIFGRYRRGLSLPATSVGRVMIPGTALHGRAWYFCICGRQAP